MRIDEDKIWTLYVDSLIEEKKKTKKTVEDDDIQDTAVDNKKQKKQKRGLPPWLKKKGKKVVKEDVYDTFSKMSVEEYEKIVRDINSALDKEAEKGPKYAAVREKLSDMWADNENEFYDSLVDTSSIPGDGEQDIGNIKDLKAGESDYIGPNEYGDDTDVFRKE